MYGFIGFLLLFVVLQQQWEQGAAFAAAMVGAAIMTSKRWSPGLAWKRWRIARARAKLSVHRGRGTEAAEAKRSAATSASSTSVDVGNALPAS